MIQYRLTLHVVVVVVSKELYCKVGAAHRVEKFNFNRLGAQDVYNFVAFAGPSCSPSLHSFRKEFSSENNSLFENASLGGGEWSMERSPNEAFLAVNLRITVSCCGFR